MNKAFELDNMIKSILNENTYVNSFYNFDFEKYAELFKKVDFSGEVEIETNEYFAAIAVFDNQNQLVYCEALSPYTLKVIDIYNDWKLYYFCLNTYGLIIRKPHYNIIEIIGNKLKTNYSIFILAVIPFLIACAISCFFNLNIKIIILIFFLYLGIMFRLSDSRQRYLRKLEKKREEYLYAYYKGKYDL